MKKIKLVVSDLHLGVGRFLSDGSTNALEEFYYDDRFSEFINYYTSGEYAGCEVELILNGDIFNFLQIDFRGHFLSVITEDISLEKLKNIIAGHPRFFESIRHLLKANPGLNRVTYVVGNHDQCMMWPATRELMNDTLGTQVNFRNLVYEFDGFHVAHGHMYEAANRLDPKRFFLKKNLAEPILNLPLGSHFFVDFVLPVKLKNPYIDKVRPFKLLVRYGLVYDTTFTIRTIAGLIWYFASRIFGRRDPRRQWSFWEVLSIFRERAIFPKLDSAAERLLANERLHTVIFGHSHVYQYKHVGQGKEYFNTGTWTELTSLDMNSLGKITKLTYVLIEYDVEGAVRPRGRLKHWRGYHRIEEDVDVS